MDGIIVLCSFCLLIFPPTVLVDFWLYYDFIII